MAADTGHGDLSILDVGGRDATLKPKRTLADVRILGLRVCRRRRTDAEYIASVRKVVTRWKWMLVLYGATTVLYFGMCLSISCIIRKLVSVLAPAGPMRDAAGTGLAFGLIMGCFAGYLFVQGGASFIEMLNVVQGQRTERLMLKFHDELERSKEGSGPAGTPDRP